MSSKLHPVYVALDSHQYSRAIKLCLALPKDNILGQALLAHAYNKTSQRYKALLVLQSILGEEGFQELQLECKYAKEAWEAENASAGTPQTPAPPAASSKKGKKGKKKPAAPSASAAPLKPAPPSSETARRWSLVDHLDKPPDIDEKWETLPPPESAITDETTLSTLAVTMQSLKLFLTSYQLYCWAASKKEVDLFLRKAFSYGIGVVVAPQYTSISKSVLANMQGIASQLARVNQLTTTRHATSWVAQTALWQLKLIDSPKNQPEEQDKQKLALLPRLAETLALKCVDEPSDGELASAKREIYFLYLRTLEYQAKWQDMLTLLQSDAFKATDDTGVSFAPKNQVLEKQAACLRKLELFQEARLVFEELLRDYPDNFTYWKSHLDCSLADQSGGESGYRLTYEFAKRILEEHDDEVYCLRGPKLIFVELAARKLRHQADNKDHVSPDTVDALVKTMMEFGTSFCPIVSCAYSDLEKYLDFALELCYEEQVCALLKWLKDLRVSPESDDAKERRAQQRSYIFSVKMTHKILAKRTALQEEWLPDWKELVRTWKKTHSADKPIQKESLPGDDLILLAIQQILRNSPTATDFFMAAVLVEAGIQNSPNNGILKLAALDIYSQLNAASRSWSIYQELQIKHIQLDTCTFLILPVLLAGGFYQEILKICKGLLMLHTSVVRDTCEFSGRAMDNGILSKAEEFMFFQRDKMTTSLTAMEATGLILDSAPFFAHDIKDASLGVAHGISGGDSDFDRAIDMVMEVRNPYGALSLLRRALQTTDFESISDNRDLSVLAFETLYRRTISKRQDVLNESLRRAHSHSLLIRSALCVHYTKGPKKGKLVKPSEELLKCCKSILNCVDSAKRFASNLTQKKYSQLMEAQLELCRALVLISSGLGLAEDEKDNLDSREKKGISFLHNAASFLGQGTKISGFLDGKSDVGSVCQLLPGSIVPLFALFRMCAEVLEAFQWGKRKQKTKEISAQFAKVAVEFSVLIKGMNLALSSEEIPESEPLFEEVSDIIEEEMIAQTKIGIDHGRQETEKRIRPHLEDMIGYLDDIESAGEM